MAKPRFEEKSVQITTYDEGKGREVFVGEVRGKTFYKTCKLNHWMWKINSYGTQEEVIQRLFKMGVEEFVFDTEKHGRLTIPMSRVMDDRLKSPNHNHGKQRHIPVSWFNEYYEEPKDSSHMIGRPEGMEKKKPDQGELFS